MIARVEGCGFAECPAAAKELAAIGLELRRTALAGAVDDIHRHAHLPLAGADRIEGDIVITDPLFLTEPLRRAVMLRRASAS